MRPVGPSEIFCLALILLVKLFSPWLSPDRKKTIIRLLSHALYLALATRRRLTEEALATSHGPTFTRRQIKGITRKTFQNQLAAGYFFLFSPALKDRRTAVEGLEHLQAALARGKGVILWESNGFGNRHLTKQVLYERGFHLYQVHAMNHGGPKTWIGQRVIRRVVRKAEERFVAGTIDITEDSFVYLRTLVERLKSNGIVCIAAMGERAHKIVQIRFLGQLSPFASGIVSLARSTGAPIIPIFGIEGKNGRARVVLEKPLELRVGEDTEQNLLLSISQYAGIAESYIREHPDQYYLWHKQ